jgi:hypothetical protein
VHGNDHLDRPGQGAEVEDGAFPALADHDSRGFRQVPLRRG